ncbi:hypothetical protein [Pseudomonas citronellolis]|nr:hypothetical protein [Pseudomonas citronellolis]MDF3936846.1 hypothetical protein [Pseudomonas citronellolis]
MSAFHPGPPYFFICRKCAHRFSRSLKLGLFCPACKSLRVEMDRSIRK